MPAVVWGVIIVDTGWPRPEIYGTIWKRRFAAPVASALLLLAGALYFKLEHGRGGSIPEMHRATVAAGEPELRDTA